MRRRTRFLAAALLLVAGPAWGQATQGSDLFANPDKGNCIACHQVPEGAGPAVRADVGPRLDSARLKGWDRARLRALLEDPQRGNPDTVMPPYGRHRLLDDREIERVIDYLHALP
ncbi:MAG: sulfur oxidation c-type cytochrome SoxX [Betaproteobacteria bacterium]|nr:sulfur oxidation c-type cytochrome SoxX [Betaproteobacteria bacterium]